MGSNTITKPTPTIVRPQCNELEEFDPCSNAKPSSPFYLYNHDSPRASFDNRPKISLQVSVKDLEAGSEVLTPSISQEKMDSLALNKSKSRLTGMLTKQCTQMTRPKTKTWLQRLTRKQRIIAKLVIAFVVIGCMVAIAVGIAVGLKSGVNKPNGQS